MFTPVKTLCQWNLECDTKFSMNIVLILSNVEQVSIRQTIDGVVTELSSSTTYTRDLNTSEQLPTVYVYSVTDVDSVKIVYSSSGDHNSTNLIAIDNYKISSDDEIYSEEEIPDDETPDEHTSNDSSSSTVIIILIVLIILLTIALVLTIVLCYFWKKKRIESRRVRPRCVDMNNTEEPFDAIMSERNGLCTI